MRSGWFIHVIAIDEPTQGSLIRNSLAPFLRKHSREEFRIRICFGVF